MIVEVPRRYLGYRRRCPGKLTRVVKKLVKENPKCWLCESTFRLQGCHLVSQFELFLLGLQDRYIADERNLIVMCFRCHKAFDFHHGIAKTDSPAYMHEWYQRHEAQYRKLDHARTRVLAVILREADAA